MEHGIFRLGKSVRQTGRDGARSLPILQSVQLRASSHSQSIAKLHKIATDVTSVRQLIEVLTIWHRTG